MNMIRRGHMVQDRETVPFLRFEKPLHPPTPIFGEPQQKLSVMASMGDVQNLPGQEMIGHRDLAMTDRYSHLTQEHKHAWQAKLAEHYAGN
jgi:hypothetical protein